MGLTRLLARIGLTRDSVLLDLAAVAAALTYLGTQPPPWEWNYYQWIAAMSGAVIWYTQRQKTSGLPGENDDKRISHGPRLWFLPLILAASIGASSCLPKAPAVVNPNPTAEQVQAVREQAAVLARATVEASALAVELHRLAHRSWEAGVISSATMQKINSAAIATSDKGIAFVEFAKTVTADPSLRVTARELLRVFDDLINALIEGKQGGETIRAALNVFRIYLGVA
jgi:hypothetical protein